MNRLGVPSHSLEVDPSAGGAAGSDDLERELRALGRGWAAKLPGRLQELDDASRRLLEGDPGRSALERVHFLVHRLGGSGATFGFPEVTRAARSVERSIRTVLDSDRAPRADEIAVIRSQLAAVHEASAAAVGGLDSHDV